MSYYTIMGISKFEVYGYPQVVTTSEKYEDRMFLKFKTNDGVKKFDNIKWFCKSTKEE